MSLIDAGLLQLTELIGIDLALSNALWPCAAPPDNSPDVTPSTQLRRDSRPRQTSGAMENPLRHVWQMDKF